MKRRHIVYLTIVSFVVSIALVLAAKPLARFVYRETKDAFWTFVCNQLDKEEQERQERIARGEIVRGKDTALIWGNKYEIWHSSDGKTLDIYRDGIYDFILLHVTEHKIIKNNLYIISDEGYAVIDRDNLCRVYITVPEEDFVNGYGVDEQGNKTYYSRYLDNPNIKYLSSLDDFSYDERRILKKLKDHAEK